MNKRFNFKDDFEMLYLRHEYIKKIKKLDPDMVKHHEGIVHTTAKIMFNRLSNFEKIGFAEEDVISIANLYMLYYMALYSIRTNPKEMWRELKKRKKISLSKYEIWRIDRNRLITFLRQKLHHCGTLCARKARNITVGTDKRGVFAETDTTISASDEMILNDYKKYGYRKITWKEYKQALNKARLEGTEDLMDSDGFRIFKIEILNNGISESDYKILMESSKSLMYHPPDIILETTETEDFLESKRNQFNSMAPIRRKRVLNTFIKNNKDNKYLKKELKLAKKMLKNENTMV